MSNIEWLNKLNEVVNRDDDHNPTKNSLLYMLNHMIEEYDEYKKLGTVEDFRNYKEYYERVNDERKY